MKTIYTLASVITFLLLGAYASQAQVFTPVDIYAGADSSLPFDFASFNGKVYFQANDGIHGAEAWISDGTPAGTTLLADIWPGSGTSNPHYFTVWNNAVYFVADDSVHGFQVWTTNGTPAGTSMLVYIPFVSHTNWPYYFTPFNNKLFFGANDSIHGTELWETDGTSGGTSLVADNWPGAGSSSPGDYGGFGIAGGKLFFDANDSVHGNELWVSDGTTAGTHMVADIWAGTGSSGPGG